MRAFEEEINGIYRQKIPFDTVETSVFLIEADGKKILVDSATTDEDVDGYIVPALSERGYFLCDVDMLVLTHNHGDHAGGSRRIRELAPSIQVITDVRELAADISTLAMPGHTEDCIGVVDVRTHTLISGDGLQGAGVDKYRCYTQNPKAYLETIEKIKNDERIENILFSHAYEPWNSYRAIGREKVNFCLSECEKYVKEKAK